MTDLEFVAALREYLKTFSPEKGSHPVVPHKNNPDGTIDREGTLTFPCFLDVPTELRKTLLEVG